jgi:hypothetical protein
MLLTILSRDRDRLTGVKLPKPYYNFIDNAIKEIQKDLQKTHEYARKRNMKLIEGEVEGVFKKFIFIYKRYEDPRTYLNVRLRNRTEELIELYFAKVVLQERVK